MLHLYQWFCFLKQSLRCKSLRLRPEKLNKSHQWETNPGLRWGTQVGWIFPRQLLSSVSAHVMIFSFAQKSVACWRQTVFQSLPLDKLNLTSPSRSISILAPPGQSWCVCFSYKMTLAYFLCWCIWDIIVHWIVKITFWFLFVVKSQSRWPWPTSFAGVSGILSCTGSWK